MPGVMAPMGLLPAGAQLPFCIISPWATRTDQFVMPGTPLLMNALVSWQLLSMVTVPFPEPPQT